MPTLYIVATPIGNLEDITLRALRVLSQVGLIAAEDTRVTRKLLARHDIRTRLTSYHEHNKRERLPSLMAALREQDVALVSDAGMPGINDPGWELVQAAREAGADVAIVPGASAVTAAIGASGMAVEQFTYLGFLPRRRAQRKRLLESLAAEERVLVAFEAPHRMKAALADILDVLGDRSMAVCRELTKLHEEVFRGTVSEALAHFGQPRGEFTLVVEGAGSPEQAVQGREEQAHELLERLRADGIGAKEAVARAVEASGMTRRAVYRLWLEVGRGS